MTSPLKRLSITSLVLALCWGLVGYAAADFSKHNTQSQLLAIDGLVDSLCHRFTDARPSCSGDSDSLPALPASEFDSSPRLRAGQAVPSSTTESARALHHWRPAARAPPSSLLM
ncbi:hypothetical protein [Litorivivens sp.]|uniref:hypothetical protein n=1 Tax=Litorivivens sp. TaxID=2020868 RepID=UPI003564BFBF